MNIIVYIIYILLYHVICAITIVKGKIFMIKQNNLILAILILLLLFSAGISAQAAEPEKTEPITYEETIRIDNKILSSGSKTSHITGSKTRAYKDAKGNILWSVTVTASFSYDGSTSKCTSASASASVMNTNWKIISKSSSRNGNEGKATAIAEYRDSNRTTRTVTIKCSKTGALY